MQRISDKKKSDLPLTLSTGSSKITLLILLPNSKNTKIVMPLLCENKTYVQFFGQKLLTKHVCCLEDFRLYGHPGGRSFTTKTKEFAKVI